MTATRTTRRSAPLHVLTLFMSAMAIFLTSCSGASDELSGTYEAKSSEGTMSLEFKSGKKVHMIMTTAGAQPQAYDGDYMIDGNKVTVQIPGGIPLTMTRDGKTLDASVGTQIMHFTKK